MPGEISSPHVAETCSDVSDVPEKSGMSPDCISDTNTSTSGSESDADKKFPKVIRFPHTYAAYPDVYGVTVSLGGKKTFAVVDSGAVISVMDTRLFRTLPRELQRRCKNADIVITGVHGDGQKVKGVAKLPVEIAGQLYETDIYVTDSNEPFLLGMSFLAPNGFGMDFHKGILIQSGREIFLTERRERTRTTRLTVVQRVTVEPRSEAVITLRQTRKVRARYQPVMIQPAGKFTEQTGLVMGRTLVPADRSTAIVTVVNVSDEPVDIPAGLVAALGQPVDSVVGPVKHDQTELPPTEETFAEIISSQAAYCPSHG